MTALTADNKTRKKFAGELVEYKLLANAIVFQGAIVCVDAAGWLQPGDDTAAFRVVGVAFDGADNTGGANGAKVVRVERRSTIPVVIAGATQALVGDILDVSDDQTATASGTNSVALGECVKFVTATEVIVDLDRRA